MPEPNSGRVQEGSKEHAIPMPDRATTIPATGVSMPTRISAAAAIEIRPIASAPAPDPDRQNRTSPGRITPRRARPAGATRRFPLTRRERPKIDVAAGSPSDYLPLGYSTSALRESQGFGIARTTFG